MDCVTVVLTCCCCRCSAAAGNVALLSLKTGQLLLVALKFEGSAASKMQVRARGHTADRHQQRAGSSTACHLHVPSTLCWDFQRQRLLYITLHLVSGVTYKTCAQAALLCSGSPLPCMYCRLRWHLLQVVVAGAGPVASCAATLTSNLLFLGSAAGDSLLVRYTSDTPGSLAAAASHAAGYDRSSSFGSSSNEPPGKRRRLFGLAGDAAGGALDGLGDAAAAGGDGFGVSLEDDGEPYRCAMGRSHSAVMPVLLGEGLKQNLKVSGCTSCSVHGRHSTA
jgi:hypothetical protein